jgi:predicted signal transduction protein with EAL and GGDEF domain
MDVEVRTRVTLAAELRDALAGGQIFLMYQPQIDVDTGRFVGVEALARWRHPKRGLVPPGIFIPIAEQSGLIVGARQLGASRSLQADEGMDRCRHRSPVDGGERVRPAVQDAVRARECNRGDFGGDRPFAAASRTRAHGKRPDGGLRRPQRCAVAAAQEPAIVSPSTISARGILRLEYLGRFPVDRIKIAQSFIVGLTSTSGNSVIIKAAIGLAHELKLDVVVEGVETAEQLKLLRSWGCRKVQGYYFSRPLTARDLSPLLRAGKVLPALSEPVAAAAE